MTIAFVSVDNQLGDQDEVKQKLASPCSNELHWLVLKE